MTRPDEPTVEVFDDPAATSDAAAERIAAALAGGVSARGRADWATTGGSTPVRIYQGLTAAPLRDRVPWEGVHVWWGDDRFVARDDPLSNVRPLDQAGVPGTIHPIPVGEALQAGSGPTGAARAYETELLASGPAVASSGFPAFDVVLIGVGPDGHILSVFPGSPLFDSKAWVAGIPAPDHVEPHVERVSLNPAVVSAARLALVVVHGAAKADIVATVLGPERDPRRWPAQLARRPGAVWLLDRAAAAGLAG
jgi:6-phosphogluconolactonase